MCGIAGFIGSHSSSTGQKALKQLGHRGPESSGIFSANNVWLGHQRLRIIDLEESADQPLKSQCGKFVLVYNGEIYNYKELGSQFGLGVFKSDTSFLLAFLERYGVTQLHHLRGMYAFCFYDVKNEKILLARDPSGIKPLYYSSKNGFAFASELPALLTLVDKPVVNEGVRDLFKATGFIPEPNTWYKDVYSLAPGTWLSYQTATSKTATGTFSEFRYKSNTSEVIRFDRTYLESAVKRNQLADVPLQFALSGGIDSSLILALSSKNSKAITVAFGQKGYDEREEAAKFAEIQGVQLRTVEADQSGDLNTLLANLKSFGQPFVDASTIPFEMLCNAAAEEGKVLIGGDGSDEIFGGYAVFRRLPYIYFAKPLLGFSKNAKLRSLAKSKSKNEALLRWISWDQSPWMEDENAVSASLALLPNLPDNGTWEESMQAFYHRVKLQSHYLRKTDIISMKHSLEYRVPFLDEDLVQHALDLPLALKTNLKMGKLPLRKLHGEFYQNQFSNRKKTGFGLPLDLWLGESGMKDLKEYLQDNSSKTALYSQLEIASFFNQLENVEARTISKEGLYHRLLAQASVTLF